MLDTKKILADNLSHLLETRADVSRLDLSKQMKVADGTLGRIKYGTGNPTVEVLDQIARFFKIQTWQLLLPNLGAHLLQASSTKERTAEAIFGLSDGSMQPLSEHDLAEISRFIEMKIEKAVWEKEELHRTHRKAS